MSNDHDPSQRKCADNNIAALLRDIRRRGVIAAAVLTNASSGDRFIYRVSRGNKHVDVDVPGSPLDAVRGRVGLGVDGQHMSWESAPSAIADRLRPENNAMEMTVLRAALLAGRRVEIRVAGGGIGTDITSARNASRGNAASNDFGERTAKLIEDGSSEEEALFELVLGVSTEQADELIELGAVEI